jgi:hypothetical protein
MTRTIPEIREWTAGVLASSLYYSTCAYQGLDSANFDALPPAERYPWIVQARAILEAQQ